MNSDILKTAIGILAFAGIVYVFTKSITRLLEVALGQAIFGLYNTLFDLILWPIVQEKYGVQGALAMTFVAMLLNFSILLWYQKTCKTDWLGINVVHDIVARAEQIGDSESNTGHKKVWSLVCNFGLKLSARLIKGKWVPLIYLSVVHDSFLATAYYVNWKHKTVNKKLEGDDLFVFFISTLTSCLGWAALTEWVTIPAFKTVWQTVN